MVDYTYMAAVGLALFATIAIVIAKHWFRTGFMIWLKNIQYKGNAGAIFLRTIGSDFAPPILVDLRTDKYEDKIRTLVYSREMFNQGKFMGVPYCFMDAEDGKTSLGLHKQQTDENGKPLSIAVEVGETKVIQPITTPIKSSVSLPPELIKSTINAIALTKTVQDFLEKNKTLLIVAGVAALAAGAGAYFSYVNNDLMYSICQQGINQVSGQITALQLNLTGVA